MKVFEWDDLRVFLAVLRGRSIRSASRLMGVSHSTVSRRLQAMESQLDLKLFVRLPEGFVLTEMGEALVERAERVESEILSMEREIFGRDASLSGLIRISMAPHVAQHLVMPHIAEFSALYPDIELEIDATYEVADLSRRNADIAIRFQKEPDDYLTAHRLPDFASAVYAAPDYIASHSFNGREPSGHWVGWAPKETVAAWNRDSPYANCKVQHCVLDPYSHLQAVKSGLGISNLLCFIGDTEPGLVRLPGQTKLKFMPAWILTHPDLVSTERVRVCVRFLLEAISKHEQQLRGQMVS
ncbi:LysR family transcriptional regulator [Psychromonas aquimarina]|uniref:LysR family transcriptional regulator n=1 Tax=Psychromonas aquimarina TaxID=444919 RepID=UPI00048B0294|nr:LysR family transcriptional regulator [Psychromonas aquimarina]